MTPANLEKLSDHLRRLLAAIDAGTMTAKAETRLRIEGALVALEVVSGQRPSLLVAHLEGLADNLRSSLP